MRNKIMQLFKVTVPTKILLEVNKNTRNKNISTICRELKISSANTYKNIEELENIGLINTEKNSRCRNVYITEKGIKVAEHIIEIQKLLKGGERKK